jgi:hypothetical protein
MQKRSVTERWKLMDVDPEEWLEVTEQSLLKQRVLASHQQFGGTLSKICRVTQLQSHPVLMWLLTRKLQGCLVGDVIWLPPRDSMRTSTIFFSLVMALCKLYSL